MANNNEGIKTTVGVKGDKEYKVALQQISRQLTVLNTDMKASQSAFGAQADTMDGMHDRLEKLNEIYEVQAKKVELIREQLEKAKAEYGENSKQADDLQIALNKASAQMNDTNNKILDTRAGLNTLAEAQKYCNDEVEADNLTLDAAKNVLKQVAENSKEMADSTKEAGDAAGEVGDKSDDASGSVGDFAEALENVGSVAGGALKLGVEGLLGAMAGLAAGTGAAIAEAFNLATDAGKYADDLMTLSSQVGVDTDKLQQWQYASNFIDTSVDTITGSMTKLTKSMNEAQEGNKNAQAKFVELGVSWRDFDGNLRDSEDVFMDAIDALGKIENPTKRDALAMELFGKSAKELNPLIEAGSRAWRDMGKEAEAMGTVFSQENLQKMGSFDDSMQKFKATGEALKNSIGLVMIPAFQPLVDAASGAMGNVAKALQDGASPAELRDLLEETLQTFDGALQDVSKLITDALPLVSEATGRLIGELAQELPGLMHTLLPAAMQLLESVLDAIVENIGPITELATELVTGLARFLIDNLPEIIAAGAQLLEGLADGIIDALPELIPAAIEMMVKLAAGLIEGIPKLVEKLPEIVDAIWKGLTDTDWGELGSELLSSLWGSVSGLGDDLLGLFTGALTEITKIDFSGIGDTIKGAIDGILGTDGSFLSGIFSDAHDDIEGIEWDKLAENVGRAGSALVNLSGEALANGFEAGYVLIKEINWTGLAETVGSVANGLVGLTGEVAAAGFEMAHGIIDGIAWGELGEKVGGVANALLDVSAEAMTAPLETAYGIIEGINWVGLGEAVGGVANALVDVSGAALAAPLETAYGIIDGIEWGELGEKVGGLVNGVVGIPADSLSGIFTAADEAIRDIKWDELGGQIADGLGRAWGLLAGVGDVALGLGESVVGAGQQGVGALKDWIASWREDGSVQSEAADVGREVVTDLAAGVVEKVPDLEDTGEDAAGKLLTAIKDVLTAETVKAIGTQLDSDLQSGINEGEDSVLEMMEALAWDARDALENAITLAEFSGLGDMIDAGIAEGIETNSHKVEEAARAAAWQAYEAARAALDINSPSRKGAWLGEMFDLGFAQGLEDNADEVTRAMGYLNDLAMEDAAAAGRGAGSARQQPSFEMDYGAVKDAFVEAIEETGVGQMVMEMDGRAVGETVEPYSSRATRRRQQQSVKGRTGRLVMA